MAMYIHFYKVTEQAREDYSEFCKQSIEKISKHCKTEDSLLKEVNRKIRKCCNLGKVIEVKNGFEVRQYFDLLFVVRDYVIEYVYKAEGIDPYIVSDEDKSKYDYIENKLTLKTKGE